MTVFLHGFWGQPRDWNQVLERLPLTEPVLTPDLYEPGPLAPHHTLSEWLVHFFGWLDEHAGRAPVQMVGYSMGARLALNAVLAKPERFARVLLLSGGVVLPREACLDREAWELTWAEKFQTQPWEELEHAWQEQPVFQQSSGWPRRRSEFLREMLGQSLVHWSIRHHPFSWPQVQQLPARVDWAYGALDQKYLEVAKTLQDLPVQGQIIVIPNAGHRLPTDAAEPIARWVNAWSKV